MNFKDVQNHHGFTLQGLIQIVILVAAIAAGWATLKSNVDRVVENQKRIDAIVQRVERYLSSKDPHYWDRVRQSEEEEEKQ